MGDNTTTIATDKLQRLTKAQLIEKLTSVADAARNYLNITGMQSDVYDTEDYLHAVRLSRGVLRSSLSGLPTGVKVDAVAASD